MLYKEVKNKAGTKVIVKYSFSPNIKPYLVDSTEGRHIHSLPPYSTRTTNTGGVLTGSAVDDGIYQDLEGILWTKCKTKILIIVLAGEYK